MRGYCLERTYAATRRVGLWAGRDTVSDMTRRRVASFARLARQEIVLTTLRTLCVRVLTGTRVDGELIAGADSCHSAIQEGVPLGFVAGFNGLVAHSETNPNLLEEVVRWGASCENPDEVVRNLLQLPADIQQHRLGSDFRRDRIEQDFDFAGAHTLLDALSILSLIRRKVSLR